MLVYNLPFIILIFFEKKMNNDEQIEEYEIYF